MQNFGLIGMLLASVGLNALAQVFLRAGMKATGFALSLKWAGQQLVSPPFLAGMGCYAVSIFLWLYVLSRLQVSLAYPFQGAGYVIGTLVAWRFLDEPVSPMNILGIVLIFSGLVCLSVEIHRHG